MISESPQPLRLPAPVRITEQVWPEGTVPVVTIRCITYNHAKFIRDAIEGFLMQETTFPVEILIHDDASTDGTADIIREYQAKYPQLIRTVLQTENQWSQGKFPRELLGSLARGEFTAVCEGDDYWTVPSKLERQVQALRRFPDCSMCFHNAWEVDLGSGKRRVFNRSFRRRFFYMKDMLTHEFVIPTASMVMRTLPPQTPGWRSLCVVGDRPSQLQLADIGPFVYLNEIMSVYRRHVEGMMNYLAANLSSVVLPSFIRTYYGFNDATGQRHEKLIQEEIFRLALRRCRMQIYELSLGQHNYIAHNEAMPEQMESPRKCEVVVRQLLSDTAGLLAEPLRGKLLGGKYSGRILASGMISVGDAWYLKGERDRAGMFYLAALRFDKVHGLRGLMYHRLLYCGLAGRAVRSMWHRAETLWKRRVTRHA